MAKEYFDYVYSIYGIGWTTDLQGTFDKIATYLKEDGIFIFSWHHTLHYCIVWSCDERKDVFDGDKRLNENGQLTPSPRDQQRGSTNGNCT